MEHTCNICGAPWHPASGHRISETHRWCGPCTKDWVRELSGMQKRRWGGERFYDHATVPPPAVEQTYTWVTDHVLRKEGHSSYLLHIVTTGVTEEEAYLRAVDQVPKGAKIWTWYHGVYP